MQQKDIPALVIPSRSQPGAGEAKTSEESAVSSFPKSGSPRFARNDNCIQKEIPFPGKRIEVEKSAV
jgi:hypothetical protein